MAKNVLTSVIITALIVAVIASLATVALTGGVIKVQPWFKGTTVYTKAEIDKKLFNLTTNERVLSMLNKCEWEDSSPSPITESCDDVCTERFDTKECIWAGIFYYEDPWGVNKTSWGGYEKITKFTPWLCSIPKADATENETLACMCCSA